MNSLERVRSTTSTNFINNLYIGVNEASNPLSHRKSSTTSSPNRFLVTQRRFLDASVSHKSTLAGIENHHI